MQIYPEAAAASVGSFSFFSFFIHLLLWWCCVTAGTLSHDAFFPPSSFILWIFLFVCVLSWHNSNKKCKSTTIVPSMKQKNGSSQLTYCRRNISYNNNKVDRKYIYCGNLLKISEVKSMSVFSSSPEELFVGRHGFFWPVGFLYVFFSGGLMILWPIIIGGVPLIFFLSFFFLCCCTWTGAAWWRCTARSSTRANECMINALAMRAPATLYLCMCTLPAGYLGSVHSAV